MSICRRIASLLIVSSLIAFYTAGAQLPARPKLVVGIVIDQMRWDNLYRFANRYAPNGGFKRLLNMGFSCENTMINYAPTITAPGHSSIYTGSVPAISGIAGNAWFDNELGHEVYCTDDKSVNTVGSSSKLGQMSPRNLLVTTICDEMRLATNFKSKTIGIAIKDRGGILPAGHSANAAYWYDNTTGDWISSTYYMNDLPKWVKDFNAQKLVDKYYAQGWNTLYPIATYTQSSEDENSWEGKPFGAEGKGFPYDMNKYVGKNYAPIATMPGGCTLTTELAKAAIIGEELGKDVNTDFLAVSYSSPDYIGHSFGPNSVETEDCYLRLDKELGELLDFLDTHIGKDQYLVFLSADHGVLQSPGFLKSHHIPAGNIEITPLTKAMNDSLNLKFGIKSIIVSNDHNQLYLNHHTIDSAHQDIEAIKAWLVTYLTKQPGIVQVFATDKLQQTILNAKEKEKFINGYFPKRSGDIQVVLQAGFLEGGASGTTHGVWNPYDAHIPLLWYGWGIKQGKLNREVNITDIAPTLAALLHIQMPSGCIGVPIPEVMK